VAIAEGRAVARVVVAALLAGVGLTGCTGADAHPRPAAEKSTVKPTVRRASEPAAAQGGACLLLNFDVVEQIVGTRFNVAGSGQSEGSFTCVLRTDSASYPDLTLAVTNTTADAVAFRTIVPKGATPTTALGLEGYAFAVPAAPPAGAGVDVGWLSWDSRLMTLRYRSVPGASADIGALVPKLTALARKVDQTSL
jgi:hypothetical protein